MVYFSRRVGRNSDYKTNRVCFLSTSAVCFALASCRFLHCIVIRVCCISGGICVLHLRSVWLLLPFFSHKRTVTGVRKHRFCAEKCLINSSNILLPNACNNIGIVLIFIGDFGRSSG